MEQKFSSPEYRRSRAAYMLECMFEYFVSLLLADAFLAKLLSSVGFNDGEIGIISSFISLAFVFQLFSLLLAGSAGGNKRMILTFDLIGQTLFFALYFLPFVGINDSVRRVLVYVFIIGAYMSKYLVSTFLFHWANSYVDPQKRASYSGWKEIVSLIGGIIFTLSMGAIFDWFEANDRLSDGFLFLAITILIANACQFTCLLLIKRKEPQTEAQAPKKKFSDILHHTLGNKNLRRLIIIAILWKCAQYFTVGFMGTFKTDTMGNGLGMTVLMVQVITMVGNVARIGVTNPLAKYSDKRSFAAGFYLSMFIAAAAFLCTVFTTDGTWYLIIGYTVLYAVCAAGSGQNALNMTYSYVDSNYIAEAMALQNCISGVCGFLCSLAAGKILNAIQSAGNTLFGIHLYGQQFLSLISVTLCVVCIIYMRLTIMKEKVIKQ